jgi:hypothetical protein
MSYHIFDKDSSLLPAFSKPFPDESLSSWLTRLSFDHGLNRSSLLRFIGADTFKQPGDWGIDTVFKGEKVQALSRHTNCTIEEIHETTLMSFNEKLFRVTPQSGISSRWVVRNYREKSLLRPDAKTNTLFCPSCFAKKNEPIYYRKQWRLTVSFVCLDCGCYLMDGCPHCKRGSSGMNTPKTGAFSVNQYFLECDNCQNNIHECVPLQAAVHILDLQQSINHCLKYGRNERGHDSVEYMQLLYKLARLLLRKRRNDNLSSFIKSLFASHQVVDFNPRLHSLKMESLPLKYRAELFAIAKWLLDEWPGRLMKLCRKYHLSAADILSSCGETPAWFEKVIEDSLPNYSDRRWKTRKRYPYYIDHELESRKIRCNNRSDYDYDPDEAYYSIDYEFQKSYVRFPLKTNHNASDLIYHQFAKAQGWY